jgi:hypothetical protein
MNSCNSDRECGSNSQELESSVRPQPLDSILRMVLLG